LPRLLPKAIGLPAPPIRRIIMKKTSPNRLVRKSIGSQFRQGLGASSYRKGMPCSESWRISWLSEFSLGSLAVWKRRSVPLLSVSGRLPACPLPGCSVRGLAASPVTSSRTVPDTWNAPITTSRRSP
jgi:hypothetical protein